MNIREPEDAIAEARTSLADWMQMATGQRFLSDGEIDNAVCEKMKQQYELELVVHWNPSAHVFEARWLFQGRPAEQLERPYSADAVEDARLLACAAVCHLIDELNEG